VLSRSEEPPEAILSDELSSDELDELDEFASDSLSWTILFLFLGALVLSSDELS